MKTTNTTKRITGYILASFMVFTPVFAFAKEGAKNGGEDSKKASSSVSIWHSISQSGERSSIHSNSPLISQSINQSANPLSSSINTTIASSRNHSENEDEDGNDDRGNHNNRKNFKNCIVGFSNLTIASILSMNLPTSTTMNQICLGTATSTPNPDTTAPILSNIVATPTTTGAVVTWTTNETSNSSVFYSTTTPVNTASGTVVSNASFVLNHSITLTGLSSGTMFNFIVKSADSSANVTLSNSLTFTTLASSSTDVTPPVINSVTPTIGTSTISVLVATNEASNIKVFYSTSTVSTSTSSFVQSVGFGSSTTVKLTGLMPATAYNLVVMATDVGGNSTLSSNVPVTTNALPVVDVTPPVLSSILANSASSSMSVSWLTNELASSKIFFSTTTPVSTTTSSFVENVSLVTSHILAIPGLIANTLYHLIVQSKDAAGNIVNSSEFSTSTTP